MDAIFVGIDVLKDRLDVAVRPNGESFSVSRTGAGIDELVERLKTMSPRLVAIEATGGFETVVAAGVAGAGLPVVVVNPAQAGFCPRARQTGQDRSDRRRSDRAFRRGDQTAGSPTA
jgi:transposase